MSMPVITLTSAPKTSVSSPLPEIKDARDISFSSYLDGAEESFVLKLGSPSVQNLTSSKHDHIFLGTNKADDKEIDVFDAEKYFNEGFDHSPKAGTKNLSASQHKKDELLEIFTIKEEAKISAMSMRSESSWNSQSALLHNIPRNQQPRKANKKSFLASIGCNCSCAGKNSVDIDDSMSENCSNSGLVNSKSQFGDKSDNLAAGKPQSDCNHAKFKEPGMKANSEGHFSFPVFNSKTGNQAAKVQVLEEEDAAKRKSLEVFGSPVLENRKNRLSLEKKLTLLTWDAIAPGAAEEINIPSFSSEMHDDSESDASSDLFEIESLSKGNNPFLSRQGSDGQLGCITPRACYAPSEASIEWSVITASAANFSILSDSDEVGFTSATAIPRPQKVGLNSKLKEIPKLRPSILSGCKSYKAVSVAGDAHRTNEHGTSNAKRHLRAESFTVTARFHDDNKLAGSGTKSRHQSFDNARVQSHSRSGHAAHLLYT